VNERDVLGVQVQAALEDLIQAQEALDGAPLDARLRARVTIDLEDAFRAPRNDLEGIEQDLAAGSELPDCWRRYRNARDDAAPIVQQCLALIQGSLTRRNKVALEVCEVADALLDDLSGRTPVDWGRFTILAEQEFIGGVSEIVRVRFPEISIWSLPIAAHELGHFIAPDLPRGKDEDRRFPVKELLDAAPDPRAMSRLYEYVADVFATYTVGPCYPIACVLLRFDPASVNEHPLDDHPSDDARVSAMLAVLERLDGKTGQYAWIRERLDELWREGAPRRAADARVGEIIDLVVGLLPEGAAYRGWHWVDPLARTLADERKPLPDASTVAPWDVVNAAWLARMEYFDGNVYDARELGDRALGLCRSALVHAGRLGAE
jgi:hypothetical protein